MNPWDERNFRFQRTDPFRDVPFSDNTPDRLEQVRSAIRFALWVLVLVFTAIGLTHAI